MIVKKVVYSCDIINCKAAGEGSNIPLDWRHLQLITPGDNKRVVQVLICPLHSNELKHNLRVTYSRETNSDTDLSK